MIKYLTEYEHNGKIYSSQLYAKNWNKAEKQLKSKRLTEKVIGFIPKDCKDCEKEKQLTKSV